MYDRGCQGVPARKPQRRIRAGSCLSINPNTIQRAYVELERQGYIYTVKGKGSFVADNTVMKENRKKEVLLQVSDMIDEAIRVGIPGDEIKNMVEIQYKAAKRNGGGDE